MFFTEEAFRKYSFTPTYLQLMKDKDKEINGEIPSAQPETVQVSVSDSPTNKPQTNTGIDTPNNCAVNESPVSINLTNKTPDEKQVRNKKKSGPNKKEVPQGPNTRKRSSIEPASGEKSQTVIKSPPHKITSEEWKETLQKGKQKKNKKQDSGYIKYPIHKIRYPRPSWLTRDEQRLYLELYNKFFNQIIPSKGVSKEAVLFKELQAKVTAEQDEYRTYLRDVSNICYKEYLFISPEIDAYLNDVIENRIKRVKRYPRFYVQHDSVPLVVPSKHVVFFHVKTLLNLGIVPKLCNHKNRMFANTKGFGSIDRTLPPEYPEQAQKKVCSEDLIADDLAVKHKVNIVISSSALCCLVDNHAPYHRQWELPIEVREYEERHGDGSIQKKRVVFIDKPFVPRHMTVRQRSEWGHKFTVKHKLQNNRLQAQFLKQPDSNGNIVVLDLPKSRKGNKEESDYGHDSDYDDVSASDDVPFNTVNIDDLETFGTGPVNKLNIFGSPKKEKSRAFKMNEPLNHQNEKRLQKDESKTFKISKTFEEQYQKQSENKAKQIADLVDQNIQSNDLQSLDFKKDNPKQNEKLENQLDVNQVTQKDNLQTSELTDKLQKIGNSQTVAKTNELFSNLVNKDTETTVSSSESKESQTLKDAGNVKRETSLEQMERPVSDEESDGLQIDSDMNNSETESKDLPQLDGPKDSKKSTRGRKKSTNLRTESSRAKSTPQSAKDLTQKSSGVTEIDLKMIETDMKLGRRRSSRLSSGTSMQSAGPATALSSKVTSCETSDNECEMDCNLITQRLMTSLGSEDETLPVVLDKRKSGMLRSASLPVTTVDDLVDDNNKEGSTVPVKRKRGRPPKTISIPKKEEANADESQILDIKESRSKGKVTRRSLNENCPSTENKTRTTRATWARLITERTPASSHTSDEDQKLTIDVQDQMNGDTLNTGIKEGLVKQEDDSNEIQDTNHTSGNKEQTLAKSTDDCPSSSKKVKFETDSDSVTKSSNIATSDKNNKKAKKKRGRPAKTVKEKTAATENQDKTSPDKYDFVREEVDEGNYMEFIDREQSEDNDEKISQFLDVNIENLEQDLDISESDSDISVHSPSKKSHGLHFSDEEDSDEERRSKAKLAQQQWIASVRKCSEVHTKPSGPKMKSATDGKATVNIDTTEGEHKKPAVKVKAGLRKVIDDFDNVPVSKPPRRNLPSVKFKPQRKVPEPTDTSKEIAETVSLASLIPSHRTNILHIPVPRRLASVPSENQSLFTERHEVAPPASPTENVIFSSAPGSPCESVSSRDTPMSPKPTTEFVDNPVSPPSVPFSQDNSKGTLGPKVIPLEKDYSQVTDVMVHNKVCDDTNDEQLSAMYTAKSTLQIGKLPGITPLCNKRPADIPDVERDILAPPKRFSTFKRIEVEKLKVSVGQGELGSINIGKSVVHSSGDGNDSHKTISHEQASLKSKRTRKPASKEMNQSIGILDQLLPPETQKCVSKDNTKSGITFGVKETVASSIDSILNKVLPRKQKVTKMETVSSVCDNVADTNNSLDIDQSSKQGNEAKHSRHDSKVCSPPQDQTTDQVHSVSHFESQQSASQGHVEKQIYQEADKPGQHVYQAPTHIRDPKEWEMYEKPEDYTAPKKHNVTYNLWQLGHHRVLIRCGLHCAKIPQRVGNKVDFIHLLPKLEYQSNHGYEQDTMSELSRSWISLAIRNNCKLHKLRIMSHNSEIINKEELTLDHVTQPMYSFSPQASVSALDVIFHKLYSLQPGHYLLGHSPGNTQAHIKKTSQSKVGVYDLHTAYNKLQTDTTSIPWVPVDTNKLSQIHLYYNRIPCTFEPKDSEEAKKFQQTNKGQFKGNKKNKKKKKKANKGQKK